MLLFQFKFAQFDTVPSPTPQVRHNRTEAMGFFPFHHRRSSDFGCAGESDSSDRSENILTITPNSAPIPSFATFNSHQHSHYTESDPYHRERSTSQNQESVRTDSRALSTSPPTSPILPDFSSVTFSRPLPSPPTKAPNSNSISLARLKSLSSLKRKAKPVQLVIGSPALMESPLNSPAPANLNSPKFVGEVRPGSFPALPDLPDKARNYQFI